MTTGPRVVSLQWLGPYWRTWQARSYPAFHPSMSPATLREQPALSSASASSEYANRRTQIAGRPRHRSRPDGRTDHRRGLSATRSRTTTIVAEESSPGGRGRLGAVLVRRSARRHDELRSRIAPLRGVDRNGLPGKGATARGRLRSVQRRAVRGRARRWRHVERSHRFACRDAATLSTTRCS